MDKEIKKAIMLLKSLILHFHGLSDEEKEILKKASEKYQAQEELKWGNDFIALDYLSANERSCEFINKIMLTLSEDNRYEHLVEIWQENYQKGYVTEMETTAILKFAKDWNIENRFIKAMGQ